MVCLSFVTGYPVTLIIHWGWIIVPVETKLYLTLELLNDFLLTPTWYSSVLLMTYRYFIIYYDIQFATCCLNLEWKKIIHHDIETLKKDQWYIQHRKTLVYTRYMIPRIICISAIFSIIAITGSFLYSFYIIRVKVWIFVNIIVFGFTVISACVIRHKMPFFNDNIYLYKEFR